MKPPRISILIFSLLAMAAALVSPTTARADTTKFDAAMKPVLEHYLAIQTLLAADKREGVARHAKALARAVKKVDAKSVTGEHAKHYGMIPMKVAKAATELAATKDLAAAREAFKKVSRPLAMWGEMSKPEGVAVVFCSMAKASWLQRGDTVKNPYMGTKMLSCGEFLSGGPEKEASAASPHGGKMDHSKMKMAH